MQFPAGSLKTHGKLSSYSEISQFSMAFSVEENIPGFDVPVDFPHKMEIFQTFQCGFEDCGNLIFSKLVKQEIKSLLWGCIDPSICLKYNYLTYITVMKLYSAFVVFLLTVLLRSLIISDTDPAPQYSITIHRSVFLKQLPQYFTTYGLLKHNEEQIWGELLHTGPNLH